MKFNEVLTALPVLLKHDIVPFLWGNQGVGKTSIIKQYAASQGPAYGFVHLHLATQEVGDLIGLLIHSKDGESVHHARPRWFPTEGEGVIFLDELNRAHPDVINAIFSLVLGKKIHEHVLPPGWKIVAAGNYQNNNFNVSDTSDKAWRSRFCHIDFKPSVQEFAAYLEAKGHQTVADFIREQPDMLGTNEDKFDFSTITLDPRALAELIGPLDSEPSINDLRHELYQGILGPTAAAAYMVFKEKRYEKIRGMDILNKFNKALKAKIIELSNVDSIRFDLLNDAAEEILLHLDKKDTLITSTQLKNFKEFLITIPLELSLKINKRLEESKWSQKHHVINDPEFIELFKERIIKGKVAV